MAQHKLLGICGALRRASTNRLLLNEAARIYGPAQFSEANLRLPLYDGDLETGEGIPADVQTLADQIAAADAVLISSPEYNAAVSGVLKNALDWVSRVKGNPWAGKPVAIMSAAAGRAGGARGQYSLRLCLATFQTRLLQGPEMMLAASGSAFDKAGQLVDARSQKSLTNLVEALRAEVNLLAK